MINICSPIDGSTIGAVRHTSLDDLNAIFQRAEAASKMWSDTSASSRGRILFNVSRLMRERLDEVSELETLNTGKKPFDTRREAERAADCFEYYAGYADKVTGSVIPVSGYYHTYTQREPYGIVVGIIPWNVPYFFAAKKIAPALAFGNVSILKPASETPLTALLLARILLEAGVPDGVVQIVLGGAEIGKALVSDYRSKLVVFTGSDRSGVSVAASAASHLSPVALELGGKSPQLVFQDADLDAALEGVLQGFTGSCGQMCIAGSRLYVQKTMYKDFISELGRRVEKIRVGDPRDTTIEVGPQVTKSQAQKTSEYVRRAQEQGAHMLAQSQPPNSSNLANGFYVVPTVFENVDPNSELHQNEVFGPVLAVDSFENEADAVRLAHRTRFGLAAGIWTGDIGRALRLAGELRVGNVWVNTYRILSDMVPFGGVGDSGYGREGGADAVNLYTWTKSVWIATTAGMQSNFLAEPS